MSNRKKVRKTKTPKIKKPFNWKNFFVILISGIVVIGLIVGIIGVAVLFNMVSSAPDVDMNAFESQQSSQLVDRDGNVYSEIGYEIRTNVTYEDLPSSLVDALIAVEDSRFFDHPGFDVARFAKAMIENVKSMSFSQGGSTITMQLVKNSYFVAEGSGGAVKSVERKVQEIALAMQVESQTNKKSIIEFYLNKISFGGTGNIRGVQQASQYYFGKDVSELTLSESALIAGILNNPFRYDPFRNLDYATSRRNTVLNLMVYHGYITEQEANLAKAIKVEDLLVDSSNNRGSGEGNPYQAYVDAVVAEVKELTGKDPTVVPMTIYTAMDRSAQEVVDQIQAGELIEFPDEKLEIGIASINNSTGEIVAIGGGRNYADGGSLLFNHATDQYNQPGSTVKPFLSYALAFEYLGWSTSHVVIDQPIVYRGTSKVIKNANGVYNGQVILTDAVGTSLNTPAMQALQEVIDNQGRTLVAEYLISLGFSKVTVENFDTGYAIGGSTFQANCVELASAQATMMNYGSHIEPHTVLRIEFADGSAPIEPVYTPTQVISEEAAYLTTELYYNNVYGSYSNYMQILKRNFPTYAKTGTSNWGEEAKQYGIPVGNSKDRWMIASTSEYTTAVWTGYEKAYSDYYWTNSKARKNIPGNINSIMIDTLAKISTPKKIEQPSGVVEITHILGTFPYASLIEGQTDYIITGKIKQIFATLVEPQSSSIEPLADFQPTLDTNGNIKLQWSDYPDPSKLSVASTTLDMSQELGGKYIEAYGTRLFDWTWLYGAIKYEAEVYVDDVLIKTITSSSSTAEDTMKLTPGSTIRIVGYYVYENSKTRSNEKTVVFNVADEPVTLTAPADSATIDSINQWLTTNGLTNVEYKTQESSSIKVPQNKIEMEVDGQVQIINAVPITMKLSEWRAKKITVTTIMPKEETPSGPTIENCKEEYVNKDGITYCNVCNDGLVPSEDKKSCVVDTSGGTGDSDEGSGN